MLKPESCNGCPIATFSPGFMQAEGEGSSGVVILGEKGGFNEHLDGLPFRPYAQAGSKLEEVFKLVQRETGQPCTRGMFRIYNSINCCPPDKLSETVEKAAMEHCAPNVDKVMREFHTPLQKTILALGNVPLMSLTGMSGVAEEKQSISHLRGFVIESRYGLVVPSYHPSFIKRGNNHLTPMLVEDMKRAIRVAKGLYSSYTSHRDYKAPIFQTSPSIDEARTFYYKVRDNQRLPLGVDIETIETAGVDEDEREELVNNDITLVQFSLSESTAIAMPYRAGYIEIIRDILALSNNKLMWNGWNFDSVILKSKGLVIGGKIHDGMWMWKHYHPKLPRGLQSVASVFGWAYPWKHLYGSQLEYYGCTDACVLHFIINRLVPIMKAKGVWEGYKEHVYNVHPILERAREVGIPVSEDKRLALEVDFKERRAGLHKELQKVIPDEIRNIRPKRKVEDDKGNATWDYGYIREPKTVGIEFDRYQSISKRVIGEGKNVCTFEEYLYRKHNLTYAEFEELDEGTRERVRLNRWCVVEDFKASSTQLIRYLRWRQEEIKKEIALLVETRAMMGGKAPDITQKIKELEELVEDYEVPISLKTRKETTSKQELEEMYINTGDKVLEKVVRIRSLDTNLTNYLPNWKPSKDGRVHTTWGYTAPSGQFDARRPNILNCSKHTEFGNEFRGIIEAPKGRIFVEFDKKSFHVGTLGYCANDAGYIRFSQLDPHSILGSYIAPELIGQSISLKWGDDEIRLACAEFKKQSKLAGKKEHGCDIRQQLAKPTVLGNQLELGPKKLQRQNRRFIEWVYKSQRLAHGGKGLSAEELQAIIGDLFPKETLYKAQIKEKAHIEKFLVNEFGRVQYFYDVFNFSYSKKMGKWIKKDGDGARDPIAFRVQGCAFGLITDEIREMERQGLCEEYQFVNTIHDSVIFLPEVGKLDKCIESVFKIMDKPCSKLVNDATGSEGLRITVEVAVGRNWKGWDKEQNPEGMKEIKI